LVFAERLAAPVELRFIATHPTRLTAGEQQTGGARRDG
jgi:hypothetical protein